MYWLRSAITEVNTYNYRPPNYIIFFLHIRHFLSQPGGSVVAGIPFLNWPEIKCMQFFFISMREYFSWLQRALKRRGEPDWLKPFCNVELLEVVVYNSKHSVCQSRKIHRLVTCSWQADTIANFFLCCALISYNVSYHTILS